MALLFKSRLKIFSVMLIVAGLTISIGFIRLRIAIALFQAPQPQAILVLGGENKRIKLAAQFIKSHPDLEVWVSDFLYKLDINQRMLKQSGISERRIIHYDFCATDTVTNFTCTLEAFTERDIRHLYLITSDYHMPRAIAIASLIFGSRGITVTPVSLPSEGYQPESKLYILRDSIRSIVWLLAGYTGASFNPDLIE